MSRAAPRSFGEGLYPDRFKGLLWTSLDEYITNIVMPTSVHIPKPILDAVDQRARKLNMSRNRFIVQALEREVSDGSHWSPGFLERLTQVDSKDVVEIDEMVDVIKARRTRKRAPRL